MISAFQAARYLLEKCISEENIHQLKLNRLVILAHGWCLAITGKPMLNEEVVAYKYGPIILSLWYVLGAQIKNNDVRVPYGIGYQWPEIPPEEIEYKQLLDKIWEVYGRFSETTVSKSLTKNGGAWDSVWKSRVDLVEGGWVEERENYVTDYTDIPNDLIKLDFIERLKELD